MTPPADLNELARRVIDGNHYMVLGTRDPDGEPRLSPVYYTPARYTDLYWVSSPDARHSRNIAEHPEVRIVIYDSTVPVGAGECVYLSATAKQLADEELERACPEAFRTTAGARPFAPAELRGDALIQLYVAHVTACEVHVPGRHPVHGRGLDSRQAADPLA
jgi:Pyridoxamine 5'-phosphate oxidase